MYISSLGVRPLFRNIKITINALVFSPTKNKWGTSQSTPLINTHTQKLMKS